MSAEEHDATDLSLPEPSREPLVEESLTDIIDQWRRQAFQRALERRHAAPVYAAVIESANLIRTTSS